MWSAHHFSAVVITSHIFNILKDYKSLSIKKKNNALFTTTIHQTPWIQRRHHPCGIQLLFLGVLCLQKLFYCETLILKYRFWFGNPYIIKLIWYWLFFIYTSISSLLTQFETSLVKNTLQNYVKLVPTESLVWLITFNIIELHADSS